VKSLDELIQRRNVALAGIRRLQLRIVAIDELLTSGERSVDQVNDWQGDIQRAFPHPQALVEGSVA